MEIARQLAAIAFVFALLGAAVLLLRRYRTPIRRRQSPAALEVLEQLSLGPGHRLHLVRVGARSVLIATHAAGSTLLESSVLQDKSA